MAMKQSIIEEKSYQFYNIVPCLPGQEELLAQGAIELEAATGIDMALYCLTLHPEGYPASRKAEKLIESYRRFSLALRGSRVHSGILVQSILGHWPRVDKNEEHWQRTVDSEGNTPRFCPLDQDFRQYIRETIRSLAMEHPCFMLCDDDIRSFSPHVECFCPLHTAEFNHRTGRNFTPEEYRKAVRECAVGDDIYRAFEQLRQDTVNGVCRLIREAVDSVDGSIPAGTCMPGWELRFNGDASRCIAAKGQAPVMRVASGYYMEQSSNYLPENHLLSQALRLFHKDIPVALDEADTFPHSLYSKSARSFHTKNCSAMFAGLNGAKIWYVNSYKKGRPISRKYTDVLAQKRYFDHELAATLKNSAPQGIIVPVHDRFPKWHPVHNTNENFLPEENWVSNMLGMYGIPFQCSFELDREGIYAVSGRDAIDRFSDEQILQLLAGKLLLDGQAAVALTLRGFSEYMGISAEERDFKYNGEYSTDWTRSYPMSKSSGVPFLNVLSQEAEILSNLCYSPFCFSSKNEVVCPSAVLYHNALGGKVCCTAYHRSILYGWANEARKDWLVALLDRLDWKQLPFVAKDYQWLMLLHNRTSKQEDVVGMFNLGFDPLENPSLRCAHKPERMERLADDGLWHPLEFSWQDNAALLPLHLECYEMAALKIIL